DGNLTIDGDLDLSGYRYGPTVNPAVRGSGEPGMLVLRAGGDLTIKGSVNDGFAPPPGTPDDKGWGIVAIPGGTINDPYALPAGAIVPKGARVAAGVVLDFDAAFGRTQFSEPGKPTTAMFSLPENYLVTAGEPLPTNFDIDWPVTLTTNWTLPP